MNSEDFYEFTLVIPKLTIWLVFVLFFSFFRRSFDFSANLTSGTLSFGSFFFPFWLRVVVPDDGSLNWLFDWTGSYGSFLIWGWSWSESESESSNGSMDCVGWWSSLRGSLLTFKCVGCDWSSDESSSDDPKGSVIGSVLTIGSDFTFCLATSSALLRSFSSAFARLRFSSAFASASARLRFSSAFASALRRSSALDEFYFRWLKIKEMYVNSLSRKRYFLTI